jgi:D-alanine-D-alanine ligase
MSEEIHKAKKIRVGLLFGGRSAEHEVSLTSAKAILEAFDTSRYDITLIGITRQGRWLPLEAPEDGPIDPAALMAPFVDPNTTDNTTHAAILGDPTERTRGLAKIVEAIPGPAIRFSDPLDVVFPVLHGPYGEDGTLQGLLELAGLPYVGSGVLASSTGMDKVAQKNIFKAHGLPVIDYKLLKRSDWENTASDAKNRDGLLASIEVELGFPCFVKPVNMGSSVGVSKATNHESLIRAIDTACRYDRKILLEKGCNPRELEVAVLGNDEPLASVVGEMTYQHHSFYNYEAKYQDNNLTFHIPADIPTSMSDSLRQMAIEAFKALDCAGMTRVDFFLDRDTNQIYLNEVNTIPGFTPVSMYPMLWQASGLPYPKLIDRLIELAFERYADKSRSELYPS